MCKPEPPGVTACPVIKAIGMKTGDTYREGLSLDYVLGSWIQPYLMEFSTPGLSNKCIFWLGHISWLAIIFNQQVPDEQYLPNHYN